MKIKTDTEFAQIRREISHPLGRGDFTDCRVQRLSVPVSQGLTNSEEDNDRRIARQASVVDKPRERCRVIPNV